MIIIISILKNSADIIESWIRGNAVIADKFIVIDNNSSDGTVQILKLLKAEGFDIEILKPESATDTQKKQMNYLMEYAAAAYNPDWILPFDDDEILASDSVGDIKKYLNELDRGSEARPRQFKVRWRVYTYTGSEPSCTQQPSPPDRLEYCFINNQYELPTVLMSRELINGGYKLTTGNHALVGVQKGDLDTEFLSDLYLAHYPIRSKEQIISKFMVGWINYLSNPLCDHVRKDNCSYWKTMYEDFKRNRAVVDDKYLRQIIGYYRQKIRIEDVDKIVKRRINLPPSAFEVKYGGGEVDYLYNFMCNAEDIAKELAEKKRSLGEEEFDFDFFVKTQDF